MDIRRKQTFILAALNTNKQQTIFLVGYLEQQGNPALNLDLHYEPIIMDSYTKYEKTIDSNFEVKVNNFGL